MVNPERIYTHKSIPEKKGPVIYWMSREQRISDNWSLLYALELARSRQVQMAVIFCLVPDFLGATWRQYSFMIKGLEYVNKKLHELNIPFYLVQGDPVEEICKFTAKHRINHIVCDFDPIKIKRNWIRKLGEKSHINITEVDGHNIVPCRRASLKQEFGAYTLRPKIRKLLPDFLDKFPDISPQKYPGNFTSPVIDWEKIHVDKSFDNSVPIVNLLHPGENAAMELFSVFLREKLMRYGSERNDPNKDSTSNLSPYFHFGQLSPQRVALEIITHYPGTPDSLNYLDELIVRRELSDNYCFYNPDYDNFQGLPEWAKTSLNTHRKDERDYIYSLEEFETAKTHDPLWNAAQMEMVITGKMHGYMRMYWAKKILEWTKSPENAFEYSIYLNDRYQLDGRDPNGYTGCAWSIGGLHDRAWAERPVFGKIRYMNYKGCQRKFDVGKYINKWTKE